MARKLERWRTKVKKRPARPAAEFPVLETPVGVTMRNGTPVAHPALVTRLACSVRLATDAAGVLRRRAHEIETNLSNADVAWSVWSRGGGRGADLARALDDYRVELARYEEELTHAVHALMAVREAPHVHPIAPADDFHAATRALYGDEFTQRSLALQALHDADRPPSPKTPGVLAHRWCDGTTEPPMPPPEREMSVQDLIAHMQRKERLHRGRHEHTDTLVACFASSRNTARGMITSIDNTIVWASLEKGYIDLALLAWPRPDGAGTALATELRRAREAILKHAESIHALHPRFVAVQSAPDEDFLEGAPIRDRTLDRLFGPLDDSEAPS
jgi:hypothetical protein